MTLVRTMYNWTWVHLIVSEDLKWLRIDVDHSEEVHQSATIFRGMGQYDWLRNGFFSDRGLRYVQDFSSGEFKAWIKNYICWSTLSGRGAFRRSNYLGNLKFSYKKLDLWRTPTACILWIVVFFIHLVHHTNCCLKYPCVGLKYLTNWCTSPL